MTRLQEKAILLRLMLEKTQQETRDPDVIEVLRDIAPLLETIAQGKPTTPDDVYKIPYELGHIEGVVQWRYPSLSRARANLAVEIMNEMLPELPFDWQSPVELRDRTSNFFALLKSYALHDTAAHQLLEEMRPLMNDIENLRIKPPVANTFRGWFTNPASPIFNKYPDLTEAASDYDTYIEDGSFIGKYFELFKNS